MRRFGQDTTSFPARTTGQQKTVDAPLRNASPGTTGIKLPGHVKTPGLDAAILSKLVSKIVRRKW